jgi:hypothetical protein
MATERGVTRPAGYLEPPGPLQLRRLAVLRVLAHPIAAARLLGALADESDLRRHAAGVLIRACAEWHEPRRWWP